MPSSQPPSRASTRTPARTSADPRHLLGREGERLAAEHFIRLGFSVIARNVRTRHGEIDLIACDGRTLAIVEVKTRRASRHAGEQAGRQGSPLELLGLRQRLRLRSLACAWLSECEQRPGASEIRFDAVGVTLDATGRLLRLEHLEAAW